MLQIIKNYQSRLKTLKTRNCIFVKKLLAQNTQSFILVYRYIFVEFAKSRNSIQTIFTSIIVKQD